MLHDNVITRDAGDFCECVYDNFFTQHVDIHTRNDAILDLVITDEPEMIHDLADIGLFPGSDHKALTWKLEVVTTQESFTRQIRDYGKADF